MKKAALVTCYFKHNYGSMLQAYATQYFLDINNIPNETINLTRINDEVHHRMRKYYIKQIFNFSFLKAKSGMIKMRVRVKFSRGNLKRNIVMRDQCFQTFQTSFNLSPEFDSINDLKTNVNLYSDFIVGSDQLWLPANIVGDYYTLNFVPENINKISYSTSFGISKIPNKYKNKYKSFLSRMNFISVRERKGVDLCKELAGKEAKLVCDPTLLLTKDQWLKIQKDKPIINDKYILCYFLGKQIKYRKFAEKLKEKTGYKIVSLNHCDEFVRYSDKYADETPYDVGPAEFLNLVRNASFVCTDSFHGTIFSIINNVKFFSFRRYSNSSKMSTNSRLDTILSITKLNDRLLDGDENIDDLLNMNIDYEKVNSILGNLRKGSSEFLLTSISKGLSKDDRNNR